MRVLPVTPQCGTEVLPIPERMSVMVLMPACAQKPGAGAMEVRRGVQRRVQGQTAQLLRVHSWMSFARSPTVRPMTATAHR